jgi:pimeloyl-ACP methyl ester carboxylesterase
MRETLLRIDGLDIHLREEGPPAGPGVLFLHGWPQDSSAFGPLMMQLRDRFRVAAMDLPGIGRSHGRPERGDKRTLAGYVHSVVHTARLAPVSLVGHDIGGQIVYAFLRAFPGVAARAAILDVVIPGVAPWSEVVRNPRIWHFGFHAVPQLPELLVAGHQERYFDFFFDAIAAEPARICADSRRAYAAAYRDADSLCAGFDWYRAFPQDEEDNRRCAGTPPRDSGALRARRRRGRRARDLSERPARRGHDTPRVRAHRALWPFLPGRAAAGARPGAAGLPRTLRPALRG